MGELYTEVMDLIIISKAINPTGRKISPRKPVDIMDKILTLHQRLSLLVLPAKWAFFWSQFFQRMAFN